MQDGDSIVPELLDTGQRTDVTESWDSEIEMCIELAHNRSNPIPITHAGAYERNNDIALLFEVDVTDAMLEWMGTEHRLIQVMIDDEVHESELVTQFTQKLSMTEDNLWDMVVNR
jgi:hypothetical protein